MRFIFMNIDNLKDILKTNDNCYFNYYKNGFMYYSFFYDGKECLFPIPTSELANEEMRFSIKSPKVMAYIRRSLNDNTLIIKEIE